MTIPFYTSTREYEANKDEFDSAVKRVMSRGDFILGGEVAEFEREAAAWLGTKLLSASLRVRTPSSSEPTYSVCAMGRKY